MTPGLRIRQDEVCSRAVLPGGDCAKHQGVGSLSQASTKATAHCDELDITAPREKTPPTAVLATPQDLSSAPCFDNHRSAHLKQKSSLSSIKRYQKSIGRKSLSACHCPIGILRGKVLLADAKYVLCFHTGIPNSPWRTLHFGYLDAYRYEGDRLRPQCNGDRNRALFAWMRG